MSTEGKEGAVENFAGATQFLIDHGAVDLAYQEAERVESSLSELMTL